MSAKEADEPIVRRNRPGIKAGEWFSWEDQTLADMDRTLCTQQFLQQQIRKNPHDIDAILTLPEGQDAAIWEYEHVRQLCMQLNDFLVVLMEECTPTSCKQMIATDQWSFLCAAHKQPKACSAVDYSRHTLDSSAALLNSSKFFPSRLTITQNSLGRLGSVCRRVYRLFAHAFFHHRHLFDEFEKETALCRRFTVFVKQYSLVSDDCLIIPENELNIGVS